tara:strand:- start:276 stop:689 length:414 start_codon:yes stop_codon:yes gene_type:complete
MTTEEYGGSSPAFHAMTDAYNGALNSRTQNMKVRRVNKTTLGRFTISTVRLPRDMDDFHQGQVYETMIWYTYYKMVEPYYQKEEQTDWLNYQERCRTYSEAVQQHKDAVMYIELFVEYDEEGRAMDYEECNLEEIMR